MGSKAGNIIRTLLPIAVGVVTGNPWLGAAAGGIGGAIGGGGVPGIVGGALSGYGGAGLGSSLATGLTGGGGLSGLISKIGSGVSGFLSDPIGGISNGITGVGNSLSSLLSGKSDALGASAGLGGAGAGQVTGAPAVGAQGLAGGGSLPVGGGGASSFGGAGAAGAGGFGGSSSLSSLLSGGLNYFGQDQAQKDLIDSQKQSLAGLAPYLKTGATAEGMLAGKLPQLTAGFTPGDLSQDPGYQFNLSQGNNALTNRLAATGGLDSGAALKEAQQFGQGLADTTYNNAFNRNLASNAQQYNILSGTATGGQNAANTASDINTNIGEAGAAGTLGKTNTITNTLSALLSGSGARRIVGYNPNGSPIYA